MGKVKRDKIVEYCDLLLNIKEISDDSKNGLQVEGSPGVSRIGLAVDACLEAYEKAVFKKCQMIIAHHGIRRDRAGPLPHVEVDVPPDDVQRHRELDGRPAVAALT